MDVPTPSRAVAAFASFVRERLTEVGGTLAPLAHASGLFSARESEQAGQALSISGADLFGASG
jgi:hypothetical protein